MTQSITDAIRSAVEHHYSQPEGVLLLADLGNTLRANGSWPPVGDQRPLARFVRHTGERGALVVRPVPPA